MNQIRPNSFQVLPLVIKNLLIINVLFFLAENTLGARGIVNLVEIFGLYHVKSPLFKPWQIITHMFLHANFWHLFSNMLALWMFGSILEDLWGSKRFLTFYFLCGIGAAIIQLAFLWYKFYPLVSEFVQLKQGITPNSAIAFFRHYGLDQDDGAAAILNNYLSDPSNGQNMSTIMGYISDITYRVLANPTIGASGAVFGVLAAFIFLFPNREIYFYFLIGVKAKWVGLLYFGYEIYAGITNPGDNIAHWAHIGGGLVGFLLVLTWNKKNRRQFY